MDWRQWRNLSCYCYKGWTIEPKLWNFTKLYCWIWEKKLCDYLRRIGNINVKHRKASKNIGSAISVKHYR